MKKKRKICIGIRVCLSVYSSINLKEENKNKKKLHTIEAKGGKKGCVIVNVQAKMGKWIVVQKHCEEVKKKKERKKEKGT